MSPSEQSKAKTCSSIEKYNCLEEHNAKLYYIEKMLEKSTNTAVILIHGNSVIPEDFYNGNDTYLNDAGNVLYEHQYDTYAPYITHLSKFQVARRRLASLRDEKAFTLDVKRTITLIRHIADKYDAIHIVGMGYGGHVAVETYHQINRAFSEIELKIKTVSSFAGYASTRFWIEDNQANLFAWNWEMIFPRASDDDLAKALANEKIHFAYGSCYEEQWKGLLEGHNRAHLYQGQHELHIPTMLKILVD